MLRQAFEIRKINSCKGKRPILSIKATECQNGFEYFLCLSATKLFQPSDMAHTMFLFFVISFEGDEF